MARKAAAADGIRAYLAILPAEARGAVGRLRALIQTAAPAAVESRSYGILGYKVDGRAFMYCAGWKTHVSLYPVTAAMRRDHADAIAPFQVSKGTLRFPLDAPLPVALIKRLLKTRLNEMRTASSGAPRRR
jgi:uncharacterized protein YdhG (YjbR/CyaY superfamily)